MAKRDELTLMQRDFVAFYIADEHHNGTEAARKAGANPKSAHVTAAKWLKLAKVKAAIEAAMAAREKRTHVDADYIVTAAKELIERSLQREPVMEFDHVEKEMRQVTARERCDCSDPNCKGTRSVGIWKYDSQGVAAGLRILALHVRGFQAPTQSEVTGKNGEPLVPKAAAPILAIRELSKADLIKLAEATKE